MTTLIKALVPAPVRPSLRAMYFGLYRAAVRARCWFLDRVERRAASGDRPIPPAMLRFRVCENPGRELFIQVGRATAQLIQDVLENLGRPFGSFESVLDFGCGCGRTMLWLPRENGVLHGSDVDDASIEWCRAHLPFASFQANPALPPLPYDDRSFDLIFGISVMTHLSEDHQFRWLEELHRVLRPGGLLLLSLHGAHSRKDLSGEDVNRLERDGFVFMRSSKLRGILPEWYHTAYHTRDYVLDRFSRHFKIVEYQEQGCGFQDLVILER